jgi:DNA polymerase/3'-5' exonuclease PolX
MTTKGEMPPMQTLQQARQTAETVRHMLADLCEQTLIAGSIRRLKRNPKDAEIVLLPKHTPTLLARLDKLITESRLWKARYVDKNGRVSHRWGSRYRGVTLPNHGMKVELFLADADNFGYQSWLRTGPGAANFYAMYDLIPHSGFTVDAGHVWRGESKVHVPDEQTMFKILRLPVIAPEVRTETAYRRVKRTPPYTDYTLVTPEPPQATNQGSLF